MERRGTYQAPRQASIGAEPSKLREVEDAPKGPLGATSRECAVTSRRRTEPEVCLPPMIKPGPAAKRAGVEDLLAIPEEVRHHEVIDGQLVEKEAATARHGGVQGRLFRSLGPYDRRPGGRAPGGWWFATETKVQLALD